MLNARSFVAFFPLERKKIGRMGKSWATAILVAQQSCVVLRVCGSAVSPGSLCGTCCRAGSRSPPPAGDSQPPLLTPAMPGSHGSSPHTQQLSLWNHSALALGQSRNLHGSVTSLVVTNLTNVSVLSVCSRTSSEWFDKVWLSSFSGDLPPEQLLLFHSSY